MIIKDQIEISDDAYFLLKDIYDRNLSTINYKHPKFEKLEDFLNGPYKLRMSEEAFLKRNFNGTLYLMRELSKYGLMYLLETNPWYEYEMTSYGKRIMKNHLMNYRNNEINKINDDI